MSLQDLLKVLLYPLTRILESLASFNILVPKRIAVLLLDLISTRNKSR